jgi:hypothetical protein
MPGDGTILHIEVQRLSWRSNRPLSTDWDKAPASAKTKGAVSTYGAVGEQFLSETTIGKQRAHVKGKVWKQSFYLMLRVSASFSSRKGIVYDALCVDTIIAAPLGQWLVIGGGISSVTHDDRTSYSGDLIRIRLTKK